MRTTKFRGKRLDTGEWVYGDYFKVRKYDGGGKFQGFSHVISNAETDNAQWNPIDPETKGEWSGLVDKNGKDIFEGDIVKYSGNTGVVEYDLNNVGGCRFFINLKTERSFEDEMGVRFAWCELDVLTTIHDPNHEELLK